MMENHTASEIIGNTADAPFINGHGKPFPGRAVAEIMNSPAWEKNSIIVIAWDEDAGMR